MKQLVAGTGPDAVVVMTKALGGKGKGAKWRRVVAGQLIFVGIMTLVLKP